MKTLLLLPFLFMLGGCPSLQYAGNASYTVRPIEVSSGLVCCEVAVINGKEIAKLDAHIIYNKDGTYNVHLREWNIAAFKGQAISSETLNTALETAVTLGTFTIPGFSGLLGTIE